jgi:NAD(P)-dependent dehydrogenase (short-subunit alcohol dehydrogenase family)
MGSPQPLTNRVALVTGGGSGLGRATSRLFAREGAHVLVADIDAEAAQQTVKAIESETGSGSAEAVALDVSDRGAVDAAIARAFDTYGERFDLLVNNAGTDRGSDLVDIDDDQWHAVFGVNLHGPMYLSRAFVRQRLAFSSLADIACVVSISALTVGAGAGAYNSSKAALLKFTEVLQTEVRERSWPVRVTAINPAAMATPMMDQWGLPPERMMDPDIVAGLIRTAVTLPPEAFLQSAVIALRNEVYPR